MGSSFPTRSNKVITSSIFIAYSFFVLVSVGGKEDALQAVVFDIRHENEAVNYPANDELYVPRLFLLSIKIIKLFYFVVIELINWLDVRVR